MRVFTTVPTKEPPEKPFLARAFDAERAWFEDDEDDGYDARDGAKLPLWDETAGVPRSDASFASYSATRAILEAAAEVPVAPMRQAAAAAALRRNPALAGAVGRARRTRFETTDRNPPVAAAVLLATARVPSARAARLPALLGVLLENVGVHAMEVVAKAFEESREERLKAQTEASESGAAEGGASKDDQNAEARLSAEPLLPAAFLTPFMASACVGASITGRTAEARAFALPPRASPACSCRAAPRAARGGGGPPGGGGELLRRVHEREGGGGPVPARQVAAARGRAGGERRGRVMKTRGE